MKQLVLKELPPGAESFKLNDEDFHYLCHVRRLQDGETLLVKSRDSGLYEARLNRLSETQASLQILSPAEQKERAFSIELYLCLCKGKKQDLMIRQAVEAGARGITLLDSRFSQVRLTGKQEKEKIEKKYGRWEKIIREAQQQSGS